jgi:hypothetical protein
MTMTRTTAGTRIVALISADTLNATPMESLLDACASSLAAFGVFGAQTAEAEAMHARNLYATFVAIADRSETSTMFDTRRKEVIDRATEQLREGASDAGLDLDDFDSYSRDDRRAYVASGSASKLFEALHNALNTTGAQATYASTVALAGMLRPGFRAREVQSTLDGNGMAFRPLYQAAKLIVDPFKAAVKAAGGDASKVDVSALYGEGDGLDSVPDPAEKSAEQKLAEALDRAFGLAEKVEGGKALLLSLIAARVDVATAASTWNLTVPTAAPAAEPAEVPAAPRRTRRANAA